MPRSDVRSRPSEWSATVGLITLQGKAARRSVGCPKSAIWRAATKCAEQVK